MSIKFDIALLVFSSECSSACRLSTVAMAFTHSTMHLLTLASKEVVA